MLRYQCRFHVLQGEVKMFMEISASLKLLGDCTAGQGEKVYQRTACCVPNPLRGSCRTMNEHAGALTRSVDDSVALGTGFLRYPSPQEPLGFRSMSVPLEKRWLLSRSVNKQP